MTDNRTGEIRAFHVLAKPIGPKCNLDCAYCFYLEKERLYPEDREWQMSDEVLELFIRQHIESQNIPRISFTWQGGEPTLLGVDYFRKAVELQKKWAGGKEITNGLQTNGLLLNDEWCSFFADNKFLIGISVGGPCDIHDKYRVNKGGGGSFDEVMRGISYLKKHDVDFNTLTVVERHNSYYPLEVYRFLKEVGSGYMQFIPIVERISSLPTADRLRLISPDFHGEARVSEWSVEPLQYGKFLASIFDEWVHHDVGQVFVQLFDVSLESWLGMEPSLCVFGETCGNATAIEHNGDLYSCDHYVYTENRLGNIMEKPLQSLLDSAQQKKFGADKRDTLPKYCRECSVKFACSGECPKHRFIKTPDGDDGLNYLCAGYKHFFQHVDFAMQFMAEQVRRRHAPAEVMQWMREQEKRVRGRNDECYCGSRKKFKYCHGA